MDADADETLRAAYAQAGRKLDMGKSCLRFKRREDLLDEAVARLIGTSPVEQTIRRYQASRKRS